MKNWKFIKWAGQYHYFKGKVSLCGEYIEHEDYIIKISLNDEDAKVVTIPKKGQILKDQDPHALCEICRKELIRRMKEKNNKIRDILDQPNLFNGEDDDE